MTEQHECEWIAMTIREPVSQRGQFFFKCSRHDCPSLLTAPQASARLDEYETLRKATERFVAFMDEYYSIEGKIEPLKSDIEEDRILRAIYADILEGK